LDGGGVENQQQVLHLPPNLFYAYIELGLYLLDHQENIQWMIGELSADQVILLLLQLKCQH
jgi:hypothetical protein